MKVLIEFANSAKMVNFEENVTLEDILNRISSLYELDVENIKLQVFDKDFDAFCDFEDIADIKNLCRIKVLNKLGSSVEEINELPVLPVEDFSNLRKKNWNACTFTISENLFGQDSKEELSIASENYASDTRLHKASHKLKRDIMDILSKELTSYGPYPSQEMYESVTDKLIKAFPYLRDPIGVGTSCWIIALKYRVQEIRRKAKDDEAKVNAGKLPKAAKKKHTPLSTDIRRKGFKKPRKGEINYIPEVQDGETLETLVAHKEQLLNEYKKREPNKLIVQEKMDITFPLRRREIVQLQTPFRQFKEEWPMIFSSEMLRKEMTRLVGIDIFPNIKVNLKNKALMDSVKKVSNPTPEEVLKYLPKLFNEKWSFYIEKADSESSFLFSEDLLVEVEECQLPPHPVILEKSSGWSIMGEDVLLLEELDFINVVSCLICIYHIFDINYHPSGKKCMLFMSVALAGIPSRQKLPAKVHGIASRMKL